MNQPSYESLVQDLGYQKLPTQVENLYAQWLKTDARWKMTVEDVLWLSGILELDSETSSVLIQSVQTIIKNDQLNSLLSFLQYVIIIGAHPSDWLIKEAPQIIHSDIPIAVFQLLTILSLVPIAKKDHEQRGIDSHHMMFNLNHLKGYIKNYKEKHQSIGIENFGWTTYLASLGLIHISSLHFMHHVYRDQFIFFRNILSHEIVALSLGNLNVRKDRQFDDVNHIQNLEFSTSYLETDDFYEGYTINPMGSFRSNHMKLNKETYEIILKPGDFVIDFHIPTKSDYSVEGFKGSLELAKTFFQKHYKDYDYKAFWCVSWLYSPQITELIEKKNSNILTIAKQGYRLPATPDAKSIYSFVFGTSEPDLESITPKTSLEQSIIKRIKSGLSINAGCFLYFIDDLNRFGSTPYLKKDDESFHQKVINNC